MITNKIYNENCLETLSKIKDNSIDLTITSPPYNMELRIRNGKYCRRSKNPKEFSNKYQELFDDGLPIEEFYELHLKIIKELIRVSNLVFYNISIVTGSKRAFFKIIGEMNEYIKDIIVWDKKVSQPSMLNGIINRQSELILIFDKKNAISRYFENANFERGTLNDIWYISSRKGRNKLKNNYHGASFPEELVEKIIINFSKENDIIYDPFLGTGTTCYVAKKLNRKYLGSEIVKDYFEISKRRLETKTQTKINE